MNKAKLKNVFNSIKKSLFWFFKSYIWIIPVLFVIDIWSKLYIESILQFEGNKITVIDNFFYIQLLYNTGAAWGKFAGQKWLLVSISVIMSILFIGFLTYKYKKMNLLMKIAFYFMIPGAVGNLIDRAFYPKGVIDFLAFVFGDYHFPIFNVADSCLVIGVIILIIALLIDEYGNKNVVKERINKESEAKNENNSK